MIQLYSYKAETPDNGQHMGFIIESNDAGVLGCLGSAIETPP